MSRRALAGVAALSLVVLAGGAWLLIAARGPRIVEAGTPLPLDQPVEMRFRDEKTGETETWKLEKKITTRAEAVGKVELPEPDPVGANHEPLESARALAASAGVLEAGRLPQASALRAGRSRRIRTIVCRAPIMGGS